MDRDFHIIPNYTATCSLISAMQKDYPFLNVFPIGHSVLGKELLALSLGRADNATLYAGAFHGQEWLTTLLLLRFAEDVCAHYASGAPLGDMDVRRIADGRGMVIVPCINPDGVEISLYESRGAGRFKGYVERITGGDYSKYNANARGVDLNHNFDAGFTLLRQMEMEQGIRGPSPRQYGGPMPESEPETRALCRLCQSYQFNKVLAFHSQGEVIYWHYGDKTPPKAKLMAQTLANSCGYALDEPDGLASHGGFKDYFIDKFERPGFTIEIGLGQNPLPIEDLDPIYDRLNEMMMLASVI